MALNKSDASFRGANFVVVGCSILASFSVARWLATDGVRTGVVRMRGGSYSRSKEPVFFWIIEALYGGLAAYCWYLALDVSLTQ